MDISNTLGMVQAFWTNDDRILLLILYTESQDSTQSEGFVVLYYASLSQSN